MKSSRRGSFLRSIAAAAAVAAMPCFAHAALPAGVEEALRGPTDEVLVQQIADVLAEGGWSSKLSVQARERGMRIAVGCAELLDESNPRAAEDVYRLIAEIGRVRRLHPEHLRMYDPFAHELFWGKRKEEQAKIAAALTWQRWPGALPEAAVRAAPAPTLAWLKSQAAEASPRLDELRLIFRAWGWWIRSNEERQHRDAVGEAIALLSSNAAVRADERTLAGLVRFAGEAASPAAAEFVLASLGHESASVRGQATVAAARIGAADAAWHQKCRDALVARAAKETDPAAAVMLSEAADEYRDDPAMGEAMLRMMRRMQNAEVQASILYSAAVAGWPQRDAMIVESLEAGSGGVVGVALQAVAQKPTPAALEPALKLLEAFAAAEGEAANEDLPQPQLIDALGALRAGPAARALGAWLESPNPAVRLKIVLALERIGGEVAREALSRQLREETNETVMEHLIGVAARMRLKGADGMLLALASDATAPPRLRRSAMVALGHFDSPDVRAALEVMAEHPADPVAEDVLAAAGREHRLDEARVLVAVSRLRLTRGQAGRAELELAESAGPAAQLTVLSTLAELGLDDPAIARGLESSDYAVLLFAVRAAERADAQKYRPRIERLRASPWIRAILGTPLDTLGLEAAFDRALAAGEETP